MGMGIISEFVSLNGIFDDCWLSWNTYRTIGSTLVLIACSGALTRIRTLER